MDPCRLGDECLQDLAAVVDLLLYGEARQPSHEGGGRVQGCRIDRRRVPAATPVPGGTLEFVFTPPLLPMQARRLQASARFEDADGGVRPTASIAVDIADPRAPPIPATGIGIEGPARAFGRGRIQASFRRGRGSALPRLPHQRARARDRHGGWRPAAHARRDRGCRRTARVGRCGFARALSGDHRPAAGAGLRPRLASDPAATRAGRSPPEARPARRRSQAARGTPSARPTEPRLGCPDTRTRSRRARPAGPRPGCCL